MSEVHCFTCASLGRLAHARILAETVRRHHPDWTMWLCLCDREPPNYKMKLDESLFQRLVMLDDLLGSNERAWIFRHDAGELMTASKGLMLNHVLEQGASTVVCLDKAMALFSPLVRLEADLDDHAVAFTTEPIDPDRRNLVAKGAPIGLSRRDHYDFGCLGVRNTEDGRLFAQWWRDLLRWEDSDDISDPAFGDERWISALPVSADRVAILREPGYNVSSLSLGQHSITIDDMGRILVAGQPLCLCRFTEVGSLAEHIIEECAPDRIEPFELLIWYRRRMGFHQPAGVPNGWWHYGTYSDGEPIAEEHRLRYRQQKELQEIFPDPFDGALSSYRSWLQALMRRQAESEARPRGRKALPLRWLQHFVNLGWVNRCADGQSRRTAGWPAPGRPDSRRR